MAKFNPIEVESALKGIDFPADKDDVRDKARENGASQDVLDALDQLPDQEYTRANEITKELGGLDESKNGEMGDDMTSDEEGQDESI